MRMISITIAILKITVRKWALKDFQFSGPASTHLELTDKLYPFSNTKMVPVGKLMMTSINGAPSLTTSANPCLPTGEVENLREIISYISPIKKDTLLNVTQSYCSGLHSPPTYQNFLIFKVHRKTKALYQAPLKPHKGFTMCSRWYLFLAHSPDAFIQANTIKLHQSRKVHDTISHVSFKGAKFDTSHP